MSAQFRTLPFFRSAGIREFRCGQPSLDLYLRQFAGQHDRRDVAKVYLVEEIATGRIAAYFAISATEVETANLGPDVKGLPRKVGAVLVGRLAVDTRFQGQGLGGMVLIAALQRAAFAADVIGAVVVVVDAIDETAAGFYLRMGFTRSTADPSRLFRTMENVRIELANR